MVKKVKVVQVPAEHRPRLPRGSNRSRDQQVLSCCFELIIKSPCQLLVTDMLTTWMNVVT